MGSMAYGVSGEDSDWDIYGFCVPPKEIVFPHLNGIIQGFGDQGEVFHQWSEHHIKDPNLEREYDFSVYNIVKYFQLVMEGNPNMVDSLFTPINMVLHQTQVGVLVRENRQLFLHKGCWHKFKGYAYSQIKKMKSKTPEEGSKRAEYIEKFGYDVKYAYHLVRLMDEAEQILTLRDIDLQRSREVLKAIRRGEWEESKIYEFFDAEEKRLADTYEKSTIPYKPEEGKVKALLLQCLEAHYGSLDKCIVEVGVESQALKEIKRIVEKF